MITCFPKIVHMCGKEILVNMQHALSFKANVGPEIKLKAQRIMSGIRKVYESVFFPKVLFLP
jgi:hypothetical protein